MAKALGIGGVFFKAKDPAALLQWYGETLGLAVDEYGSAQFSEPDGATAVFAVFPTDTEHFGSSGQGFMFNLRVDDLAGCLAAVAAGGGTVDENTMDADFGSFGWFSDPEGNRVELWEVKEA